MLAIVQDHVPESARPKRARVTIDDSHRTDARRFSADISTDGLSERLERLTTLAGGDRRFSMIGESSFILASTVVIDQL